MAPRSERLESVDGLRGIVMILMALDHVRDFFGVAVGNPTNPATTTAAMFFARWITHLCAPVFFLLTGTGAALAAQTTSTAKVSRFLFVRGVWLVVLEAVAVRWVMQFNVDYQVTFLTVLWALGWSMIALALLVHLPVGAIAAVGAVMIAAHNALDGLRPAAFGAFAPVWIALHGQGVVVSGAHTVFIAYPIVPWIGVTAVGYALGSVYTHSSAERRRILLRLGIAMTVAFLALRAVNVYGDPVRWSAQRSTVFTALSFLNTTKYPPSLLFLLMTLGPALCMLAAIDARVPKWLRPALIYGRVPLFYFLAHLLLIHFLALVVCYAQYGEIHWVFESPRLDQYPFARPPGWGFNLPAVYLIWVIVVVTLYPVCRWYGGVKRRAASPLVRFL